MSDVATLPATRAIRDHLAAAAEARRRGDLAAAECAETAALLARRAALSVNTGMEAPHA